jgi:hypothetical protein
MSGPPIIPMCMDCRLPSCKCHDRMYWVRAETARERGPEPVRHPETLGTAGLERVDALVIEGIATTPNPVLHDRPLADGLVTLGGETSRRGWSSRDPRGAEFTLPLPLWYAHDPTAVIGSVLAAAVTDEAITFRAVIERAGTPGFSVRAIRGVWDRILGGELLCVSVGPGATSGRSKSVQRYSERAGAEIPHYTRWPWGELSICEQGANLDSVLTRVIAPKEDKAAAQAAGTSESGDLLYQGVWQDGRHYRRGQMVTDRGTLWHCDVDAAPGERPGSGPPWRLMIKTH